MKKFRRNLLVHILPVTLMMLVMAFAMMLVNLKF
jgi:hypothetical protein